MKTIGGIRRARLAQLMHERGLTYADINDKLGRNRRDSTLSQIALAAPDSKTKKPREMGDAQARSIEVTFDLPYGWFDRDPEFDEIERELLAARSMAAEPRASYNVWPFQSISAERVNKLPPDLKKHIEALLLNTVQIWEANSHQAGFSPVTTPDQKFG